MKGYLLDTNVLSEVIKKRPSMRVMSRLREAPQESLFTSSVSVMELRYGAVRHLGGPRLWERIRDEVLTHVSIIPLGTDEAVRSGEILADLEVRGEPIGLEDVLIGATALVGDLVLATRNVRHLGRISGLAVEDWWHD